MASSADGAERKLERRDVNARVELITRITREFRGVAGLTLTQVQACRLFHLPPDECERILRELEGAGVLARNSEGQIVRGSGLRDRSDPA
jgi:hypothetical protein